MPQVNCSVVTELCKLCFPSVPDSKTTVFSLEDLESQFSRYDVLVQNKNESRIFLFLYCLPSLLVIGLYYFIYWLNRNRLPSTRFEAKFFKQFAKCAYDVYLFLYFLLVYTVWIHHTTNFFVSSTKMTETRNMKSCSQTIPQQPEFVLMGISMTQEIHICRTYLTSWFWFPLGHSILFMLTCISACYFLYWCGLVFYYYSNAHGFLKLLHYARNKVNHLYFPLFISNMFCLSVLILFSATVDEDSFEKEIFGGCEAGLKNLYHLPSMQAKLWCKERFPLPNQLWDVAKIVSILILAVLCIGGLFEMLNLNIQFHMTRYFTWRLWLEDKILMERHGVQVLNQSLPKDVTSLIFSYSEDD